MNNAPVTYFDVCAALRDRRELRFVQPDGSEIVGVPREIFVNTRSNRVYLGIRVGLQAPFTEVAWRQDNSGQGYTIIYEL